MTSDSVINRHTNLKHFTKSTWPKWRIPFHPLIASFQKYIFLIAISTTQHVMGLQFFCYIIYIRCIQLLLYFSILMYQHMMKGTKFCITLVNYSFEFKQYSQCLYTKTKQKLSSFVLSVHTGKRLSHQLSDLANKLSKVIHAIKMSFIR